MRYDVRFEGVSATLKRRFAGRPGILMYINELLKFSDMARYLIWICRGTSRSAPRKLCVALA